MYNQKVIDIYEKYIDRENSAAMLTEIRDLVHQATDEKQLDLIRNALLMTIDSNGSELWLSDWLNRCGELFEVIAWRRLLQVKRLRNHNK